MTPLLAEMVEELESAIGGVARVDDVGFVQRVGCYVWTNCS